MKKYCFFDIECARTDKGPIGYVCEYGYVVVDAMFNQLEKDNFLINPNCEFDQWALDNILQHDKSTYQNKPLFIQFYPVIRNLMMSPEIVVIGHATGNDIKLVNSQCNRYNLAKIKCRYYDIGQSFQRLLGKTQTYSIKNMLQELEIEVPGDLHDAGSDAYATMLICKELCKRLNMSIEDVIMSVKSNNTTRKTKLEPSCCSIYEQLISKGVDIGQLEENILQ